MFNYVVYISCECVGIMRSSFHLLLIMILLKDDLIA